MILLAGLVRASFRSILDCWSEVPRRSISVGMGGGLGGDGGRLTGVHFFWGGASELGLGRSQGHGGALIGYRLVNEVRGAPDPVHSSAPPRSPPLFSATGRRVL